ncbi:sodium:galactoside symporter [Catenovulum maritimum]|uniref:Sodium:galactoside symporter n=1 Tax=Catenovulum maritimum TaxID=1513271 RepID=A0A0J8JIJ2_9ALTE|nr:sodium:galactoside symporter [Catenovulum maritimum]
MNLNSKHSELTRIEKIAYGAGDFSINIAYASMMLLITYFYTDIFGLDPIDLGLMFVIIRSIDAMLTPFMGRLTDIYTSQWGRYRHYFLFLSIPFGLSIVLTFTTPDLTYSSKLLYAYCSYGFFSLMFTAVTIPYISILSVMTDCRKARLSASGYRLFMAKIAAFSVVLLVPVITSIEYWHGDIKIGYQAIMACMAVIAVIGLLLCFSKVKERVHYPDNNLSLLQQIKIIVKNKLILLLSASCIISTMGFMIRGALAIYFAKYYLNLGSTGQSLFLATNVIASILAMIASTYITKRFSKIGLFYKSQLLAGVVSLLLFFVVTPDGIVLAFFMFFVLSFVVDLHAPVFWASIADAVDYGEATTGHRLTGFSYCLISMSQKIAIGLSGALVGWSLTAFGYDANNELKNPETAQGILVLFAVVPALFHICVGLIMKKYKYVKQTSTGITQSYRGNTKLEKI